MPLRHSNEHKRPDFRPVTGVTTRQQQQMLYQQQQQQQTSHQRRFQQQQQPRLDQRSQSMFVVQDNERPSTSAAAETRRQSVHNISGTIRNNVNLSNEEHTATVQVGESPPTDSNLDESRVRKLVSAVVAARQTAFREEFETQIAKVIEEKLQSAMTQAVELLNSRNESRNSKSPRSVPNHSASQPEWPRDAPYRNREEQTDGDVESPNIEWDSRHEGRSIGLSTNIIHSSKIGHLIASWNIKFTGSPSVSVESFIRRLECQVMDSLGGNFEMVCEHAQGLFEGSARDWYWRYRLGRDKVTWPSLCSELRKNFSDPRSDSDIKDCMRARKQGPTEPYESYRQAIFKLVGLLKHPLDEHELVEIIQRGLRHRLREQLMFVQVHSESHLRELCLTAESVFNETRTPFNRPQNVIRRAMAGINREEAPREERNSREDQLPQRVVSCWNCQKSGHRFMDCAEPAKIFCYGCGEANVYKRNCNRCSSGNGRTSEVLRRRLR